MNRRNSYSRNRLGAQDIKFECNKTNLIRFIFGGNGDLYFKILQYWRMLRFSVKSFGRNKSKEKDLMLDLLGLVIFQYENTTAYRRFVVYQTITYLKWGILTTSEHSRASRYCAKRLSSF